jgi:type IV pilus assembly protein PilA
MVRPLRPSCFVTARRSRGFTLVEMMIVVAIIGVLAVLAVAGYRKLVQSSHVSEATGMVQKIRVAQEAYHSETQQYADVSNTLADYYPAAPVYGVVTGWGAPCTNCKSVTWSALPVHVDEPVLFGYATVAGVAGGPAPNPPQVTVNGAALVFPATPTTDWYIIAADGDLDGNPTDTDNTHVYATSWNNQVFVDHDGS